MTATRPARRSGFTLIELLVVIGLMALLAAIAVGAYFRASKGQYKTNTEGTINKIATLLERKRAGLVQRASSEPIPSSVSSVLTSYAGSDMERQRVIWLHLRFKQEFPTKFAEVAAIKLGGSTVLQPRAVFAPTGSQSSDDELTQSAACLYRILNDTAIGSDAALLDGLQNKVATTPNGNKVYRDEWNRPIAFFRMAFSSELDQPPYLAPGATKLDPIDPRGKIQDATWAGGSGSTSDFWTNSILNPQPMTYDGGTLPPATYPNRNWVLAAVSAGPKGKQDETLAEGFGSVFGTDDPASDNIVSYRLRATSGNGSR